MLTFDNSYARLPDRFYARTKPTPVEKPRIVKVNAALAALLGAKPEELTADVLSGNVVPEGADPIALAYAGHQFGGFVPQLGDGRAILLGEVVGVDGKRRDVQLKGSGRTRFSRGGDGRAALGPVLREYLVSESMHALGIPTTRALAAVTTGEPVYRDTPLPGAIVTRIASSHIRVGTFQFFAAREDREALEKLTTYALERHYPEARGREGKNDNDALALLESVIDAQAKLVARWMGVGFVHGVMNTDNTSIAGETIDYGPCAFMDTFDPRTKFSSIDQGGRYAYGMQPRIAQWNVARLAETVLPLIDEDEDKAIEIATKNLDGFADRFGAAYLEVLRAKLGLKDGDVDEDRALADDLFERMHANHVDYTQFFRRLSVKPEDAASLFDDPGAFHDWAERWQKRVARDDVSPDARRAVMLRANPAFIPRNHRVEAMISAAVEKEDFAPFERLLDVLSRPYDDQPDAAEFAEPPPKSTRAYVTFCGT
jgi:serine/tyrosine/threonine adenylyltransferase